MFLVDREYDLEFPFLVGQLVDFDLTRMFRIELEEFSFDIHKPHLEGSRKASEAGVSLSWIPASRGLTEAVVQEDVYAATGEEAMDALL
ncbi:MAG TPA: hypothetical protein PKX20_09865, partial [Methanothrix soehngenii]|nr:hypothetical protein [Methanothrix soehngenii]